MSWHPLRDRQAAAERRIITALRRVIEADGGYGWTPPLDIMRITGLSAGRFTPAMDHLLEICQVERRWADDVLTTRPRREYRLIPTCSMCWGSHGCDLPAGHPGPWHACCVFDDPTTFDPADPHNSACLAWRLDDPLSYPCVKS